MAAYFRSKCPDYATLGDSASASRGAGSRPAKLSASSYVIENKIT